MNPDRVRKLNNENDQAGDVVYWMQRDQRLNDNWALLYALELALEYKSHLHIIFCLVPKFSEATIRQYSFMLKGLRDVEESCRKFNITFKILLGTPQTELKKYIQTNKIKTIVTDFNPLKIVAEWKTELKNSLEIPFYEVDAHNIVPCWIASDKQEYGAYTIRPKINKLLPQFLEPFSTLKKMPTNDVIHENNWESIFSSLQVNNDVDRVDWITPGEDAANKALHDFITNKIENYSTQRNDPNSSVTSNLSPYFHFGQLAPQRAALAVQPLLDMKESRDSFLEELIIRRELSDNYCYYNNDYDSLNGIHEWARKTLDEHRSDKREYLYSLKTFEQAETHEDLWNAAQMEMVTTGRMHGYMRMYWAKKILEWTESPEEAYRIAIYLNDKYQLDGRDPNGYTGIAWSIGGVHDRAWTERPIFGKIRYMNYNGCKRKFNTDNYIRKHLQKGQTGFNF